MLTKHHTPPNHETRPRQAMDLDTVLRCYIADPTASWGLSTFGAAAEFHRTGDESATIDTDTTLRVVTARGALNISGTADIRACAYEVCRFARLEVYQRIPGRDERAPEGPHTHVLLELLRHQRTHPATAPIPEGWVPCLSLYPAHPVCDTRGRKRLFDHGAHAAFQALLHTFGDPGLVRLKAAVTEAVRADKSPDSFVAPVSRAARATVCVALRQLVYTDGDRRVLAAWRQAFDRLESTEE